MGEEGQDRTEGQEGEGRMDRTGKHERGKDRKEGRKQERTVGRKDSWSHTPAAAVAMLEKGLRVHLDKQVHMYICMYTCVHIHGDTSQLSMWM